MKYYDLTCRLIMLPKLMDYINSVGLIEKYIHERAEAAQAIMDLERKLEKYEVVCEHGETDVELCLECQEEIVKEMLK